jgi:DNA-binding MarR family transcriptional regulator
MVRQPGSRLSLLFELFATQTAVGSLLATAMSESPLRPDEYAVYSVLFDEGPHSPTELARRTGMPPTSMSHFVRGMIVREHAKRVGAPQDRRSYRIVLTAAGLAAHAEASAAFAEADRRFMGALAVDEEEARATLRAIGRAAEVAQTRLAADSIDETA